MQKYAKYGRHVIYTCNGAIQLPVVPLVKGRHTVNNAIIAIVALVLALALTLAVVLW